MNLAIRGIEADLGEAAADTFFNDQHPSKKMDFILANPPFNISDWGGDKLQTDVRWKYGVPPAGNANFAWLEHMIHHLSPKGRIGMVLANGSLSSQSGNEGQIRKAIIEDDLLEGIVAMPPNLFYTATVPVALWFINKKKTQSGKSLFIDARNMGTMVTRRLREMADADIAKIADTFDKFANGKFKAEKGFSAAVKTAEIAKQDYIVTPGRYVGLAEQEEDGEAFDEKMKKLTAELAGYFEESHKLEKEIKKRLAKIGYDLF
jgi:type I restriction enzyme M protein